MERSTDSPVSRSSSSASARRRPRGKRMVVDLSSTSVRLGGVHARRHQSRRRRRRRTALVATNDCDAGVPHVAHSRRGCLASSATTVQLRFTATTVDCRRRTTSRITARSRKWSCLLVIRLQSAPHVDQNIRHDV